MPAPPVQIIVLPQQFIEYMDANKAYWIAQNPIPAPLDFSGNPYPPVPPEGTDPDVSANPWTHCDPIGGLGNALSNFVNAFATNVQNPVDALVTQFATQTQQINQLVNQPILKASNAILKLSNASVTVKSSILNTKPPNKPPTYMKLPPFATSSVLYTNSVLSQLAVTETTNKVGTLTTEQLFGSLGVPYVSSKADIEEALLKKNIFLLDGIWVKSGPVDLSCAKKLAFFLGGVDLCTKMQPYLTKPAGAFTLVITHKYQALVTEDTQACAPAPLHLPTGTCYVTGSSTVQVEDVLAIDASIDAVLANLPILQRSDLGIYVFWNEVPAPTLANSLALQNLGLTSQEVALAFSVGTSSQLQACVIVEPAIILDYLCNTNSDKVFLKGPDSVDPNPSTSDIVDDIVNKALTPPDNANNTLPDNDNVPALVLGAIDLKKTFRCQGAAQSDALNSGLSQAVGIIDAGFDAANGVLGSAQTSIAQAGNTVTQLVTLIQGYTNGIPSSYTKCLFPGQGFELALPLPKALLDAMRFTLNNQFAEIEKQFSLFDNVFSGILAGFCVSQSLIQGAIGSTGAQQAGIALSIIGDAALARGDTGDITGGLSCSSFELPWPQSIKDYLDCLLQIFQIVQRLIRQSINLSRNSFSALQSLRVQFGLANAQNLNTCAPQTVISAIAALQGELKALT